jgi:eukaryotic-like serine/threonine-protein kinase
VEPEPPADSRDPWPTRDDTTVVTTREDLAPVGPPEPFGPPPPPDRRIGAGMLLGLAALALVAIGLLVAYLLTHRGDSSTGTTTVIVTSGPTTTTATRANRFVVAPNVVGLRFTAARSQLQADGFTLAEATAISKRRPGTVLRQTPRPGARVRKGSTVTLVVATAGPTKTASTSTTAATTAPATTAPATTGATTTAPSTTAPSTTSGSATTTSPTTTAAAPPTPTNATVPDVGNAPEQEAVDKLSAAGILPSLVFVPASDPLGTVEQQAKPAGTTVGYHSHVQLNISKGPHATTDVSVPNTIGRTLSEAVSTLNAAGLRLIFVKLPITSRAQVGKIVQQSPLAGGKAPKNAQVLVFLGVYRAG